VVGIPTRWRDDLSQSGATPSLPGNYSVGERIITIGTQLRTPIRKRRSASCDLFVESYQSMGCERRSTWFDIKQANRRRIRRHPPGVTGEVDGKSRNDAGGHAEIPLSTGPDRHPTWLYGSAEQPGFRQGGAPIASTHGQYYVRRTGFRAARHHARAPAELIKSDNLWTYETPAAKERKIGQKRAGAQAAIIHR